MSERDWLKYFLAKRNVGAVICEGPEIEAACAEIDRLHSDYATLLARHNALKDATVHIYNSGYHAGHHDTVEGRYVDIHISDMGTYHAEEVAELLAALAALAGEEGK